MWGALGSAVYLFVGVPAQSETISGWDSIAGIADSIRDIFPKKP